MYNIKTPEPEEEPEVRNEPVPQEMKFFEVKHVPIENQPEPFQFSSKKRAVNESELNEDQRSIVRFMKSHPFEDTVEAPEVEFEMLSNLGGANSKKSIGEKKWKISYANGTEYEGNIVEDSSSSNFEQPILFGSFVFPNGDRYRGSIGARASGTYTHKNGVEYQGQFFKLAKSGNGVQTFPDGTVYTGMFRENLYHGKGNIKFANGDQYKGTFNNGKREHIGSYSYPSGETVVGDWRGDMLHGHGRYEFTDGNKIMSAFENSAIKM